MNRLIALGIVGVTVTMCGAPGALAQDLGRALIECRDISDDSNRLACFDNLANGLESGAQVVAEAPAPVLSPEEQFGVEDLAETKEKKKKESGALKSLTAPVVDIGRNGRGKYVVILENGQIWRQLSADTGRLRIPSSGAEGLSVEIKRRSLGAHSLYLNGENRGIKVERIK